MRESLLQRQKTAWQITTRHRRDNLIALNAPGKATGRAEEEESTAPCADHNETREIRYRTVSVQHSFVESYLRAFLKQIYLCNIPLGKHCRLKWVTAALMMQCSSTFHHISTARQVMVWAMMGGTMPIPYCCNLTRKLLTQALSSLEPD